MLGLEQSGGQARLQALTTPIDILPPIVLDFCGIIARPADSHRAHADFIGFEAVSARAV